MRPGSLALTNVQGLVGLAAPTTGEAQVFGRPYGALRDPVSAVGSMLEVSSYHPGRSARNHLRLLARTAGLPAERVVEMLDLVDLTRDADRAVGGFSSGMRQRLGLASTLLGDPRLLLLDEPADGLGPKCMRWLRQFLRSLVTRGQDGLRLESCPRRGGGNGGDVVILDGRLVTQGPIGLGRRTSFFRVLFTLGICRVYIRSWKCRWALGSVGTSSFWVNRSVRRPPRPTQGCGS